MRLSRTPDAPADQTGTNAGEEAKLDDAIARADQILVDSLRDDEQRRRRRRLLAALATGGLVMTAIALTIIAVLVASTAQTTPPAGNARQAGARQAPADRALALTRDGWQLWQQRRLAEAEQKFTEATRLNPRLTDAWNGLGWALTNQGKHDEAGQAFKRVIALEPKHPAALNGLGWIAFERRDLDAAEKHWLAAAPTASASWTGLAQLYLLRENFDEAEQWAQKALAAGDEHASIWLEAAREKRVPAQLRQHTPAAPVAQDVQQGWQQLNGGDIQSAVESFQRALDRNPEDADAFNGLGWAHLRTGDLEQARAAFERAIDLQPDAAGAINGLGMVLKAQGETDRAIELWERMIREFPGPNAAHVNLAQAYLERQEYDKALPLLEQLAAEMPQEQWIRNALETARAETTRQQ